MIRHRTRQPAAPAAGSSTWVGIEPLSKHRTGQVAAFFPMVVLAFVAMAISQTLAGEERPPLAIRPALGPAECTTEVTASLQKAAVAADDWAAELTWNTPADQPVAVFEAIRAVVAAKQQIDRSLERLLDVRVQFAALPANNERREQLQHYLRQTAIMIDLSGRMRFLLRDAIENATYDLSPHPKVLDRLVALMIDERVDIGAGVMTYALFDPPADSGVDPFSDEAKARILRLIEVTRNETVLPDLVRFLAEPRVSPELLLAAANTIRAIGLPQDPLAKKYNDAYANYALPPAILARDLRDLVRSIDPNKLALPSRQRREELLGWLDRRIKFGVEGDSYRIGHFEVRPGDWLLMRNPSPYNTFTDLSPGMFTHVGVVTALTDEKGVRHFVITDLPERGNHVPATNVEGYLGRTLHYFFLRHEDERVGEAMGRAAAEMIGNEAAFDLTFRTERVLRYQGKSLEGKRIHTYCAGFLLICALQTERPREEFFPIPEKPPGDKFVENLAKLEISIGKDFVSPTGAIFSPKLRIAGQRRPMFSPDRQLKEAIYDYFGELMITHKLTPTPTTYQSLREKVAGLSKSNPWLARALAQANNVSEHMDLQAAAKAAAVVETLDNVADSAMADYFRARDALLGPPVEDLRQEGADDKAIASIVALREEHAQLFDRLLKDEVTPRQMRIELVNHYIERGRRQLRERFFK